MINNKLDRMFLHNIIEFNSHMLRTSDCPPQKESKKWLLNWFNSEEVDEVRSFLKSYCKLIDKVQLNPTREADIAIIKDSFRSIVKKIHIDKSPSIHIILKKLFKRNG